MNEMHNIQVDVDNDHAYYENDIIDKNSESNKEANEKNKAKNLAYDRIIQIAKSTGGTGSGQGYVKQRDKILTSKGENMNISLGTSQGSNTVNRIVHTNTVGRTGDGKTIEAIPGVTLLVPCESLHRATAGKEDLVFIEVQRGLILSEEDIERLEDDYDRETVF